jgi:hypothetical protein
VIEIAQEIMETRKECMEKGKAPRGEREREYI